MKFRSLLLLSLALVLGLFAVVLMRNHDQSAVAGTATVVTAKNALKFGDRLAPAGLQVVKFPPRLVPQGAFSSIEELTAAGEDRVALRTIVPGEPILSSNISGKGGRATLSTVIAQDMRAVTIAVNDVKGVAGFIRVSDRVDVMLTRSDHSQTDLLLQNAKVLGVDQQAAGEERKDTSGIAKAVTLEVSPGDAQKLTLAGNIGSLSLALRNSASPEGPVLPSVSVVDLTPAAPIVEPKKVTAAPVHSIEIVRGTDVTAYPVTPDGFTGAPGVAALPDANATPSAARALASARRPRHAGTPAIKVIKRQP
jgi:pilus assembly protein CpaB